MAMAYYSDFIGFRPTLSCTTCSIIFVALTSSRRKGFRIVIYDRRSIGDSSQERIERVIVETRE